MAFLLHRRRFPLLRCALACATLLVAGPAAAAALVLAASLNAKSLPIYVAEAQGYFAAEGVAVRVEDCVGGQRCLRRLFDGEAQLATVSELPVMFNSFERGDFAVIATVVTSARDIKLVARRSADIAAVAQLAGKRIGTARGTSAHYFLDAFLLFHDIDPHGIELVAMPPEQLATALQRREVDAIAIWEPYGWLAQRALGADALVLPNPRIYTETFNLVVDARTLAARQEELVKLLRALERAQRHIREQPRQAQAVMKARLKIDQGFVEATWADLDFRLALDQSLISMLEGEARWALREGHVPAGRKVPNYLHYIEPGPLRRAVPGAVTTLK
ncbi:MAG TPA: ABC transporter substrate-binding protein [Methylibium sp.]|nr:ABC transporter substrate-binding protein [Methylibium sp.]